MPNPLSSLQLAAYAKVYDFRSNFNKAVRQILTAYSLTTQQPGEGIQQIARTYNSCDFAVGAATGATAPLAQNLGAGVGRHSAYAQFEGTLTLLCSVPYEQEAQTGAYLITADHARDLDETVAQLYAIFMEALEPFKSSGDFLPYYDIQQILPIEPDERPVHDREVNVAYVRFRIRFQIRQSAWPS